MSKKRLITILLLSGALLLSLGLLVAVIFKIAFPGDSNISEDRMGNIGQNTSSEELMANGGNRSRLRLPPLLESDYETADTISYTVTAQEGETPFREGPLTRTYGYNGFYLGPVLRIREGQKVHINLNNELREETTFHWHGLKIPSNVDGGPHNPIEPGGSAEIDFTVTQEAATLWFHSHAHEKSAEQVYNGLAGLLFIDDDHAAGLKLPAEYGVNDFPLIIQDRFLDKENQFNYQEIFNINGTTGDTVMVNGTIQPYVEVENEWIRLRLVNGSNARNYNFHLSENASFFQIASDGGFLNEAVKLESLFLSPGERAEILLDMQVYQEGENLLLMDGNVEILSLRIRREQEGQVTTLPNALNDLPELADTGQTDQYVEMSGIGPMVTLNGRQFDMERIDFTVQQGQTEIWEVTNVPMMMGGMLHPFHIHGVQFRVLSRDGNPPPLNERGWKDTIAVSPGEVVRIAVTFEQTGIFMMHCHILEHEDNGMMGQILVE